MKKMDYIIAVSIAISGVLIGLLIASVIIVQSVSAEGYTFYTETETSDAQALHPTLEVQETCHSWYLQPTETPQATVTPDDLLF